jgi:hypothetical protein
VSVHKAILKAEEQNQRVAAAATVAGAGVRKFGPKLMEAHNNKMTEAELARFESAGIGIPEFDLGDPNFGVDIMKKHGIKFPPIGGG